MRFNFRSRINLGKGFGLNISKSGITPSVRTKFGSASSKGFSFKTGIPGLSYRTNYNQSGCMILIISVLSVYAIIILSN
jgi:hypothetical protein